MTLEAALTMLAIFGIACFITLMAVRLSHLNRPSVVIQPLTATAYIMCPACRGHGRIGLAVDPRKFTKYDDAKLKFEDFPNCEECSGSGRKLYLLVHLRPSFVDGTLSLGSSMSHGLQPGDYALGGFPYESSQEEKASSETSSTPSAKSSPVSSAS